MRTKECAKECIYAVDGVCRLENNHGLKAPECPNRDGSLAAVSIL
ncbi:MULTISPECIES: cleavage protein [unclassified Dehalobacter]|jgi:hypothetical protein|nr:MULTISPECIES: cleavage protein [unclassified Dehalobacter]